MKLFRTFLFALLLLHAGSCIAMDSEEEYNSSDTTENDEESSDSPPDYPIACAFNVSVMRVLHTRIYQAICSGDLESLKGLVKRLSLTDLSYGMTAERIFVFSLGENRSPGVIGYMPITAPGVLTDIKQCKNMQHSPEQFLPLNLAISNNNPDIFYYLIDTCMVNVNYCDAYINHPLHTAVDHYNIDFVRYLITKGANPLYKDKTVHKDTVLEAINRGISMPGEIGQDKVELLKKIRTVIAQALVSNHYKDPYIIDSVNSSDDDDFSDDDFSDDDSDDNISAKLPSSSSSRSPSSASSSLPEGSSWRYLVGGGAPLSNSSPSFWQSVDDYDTPPSSSSSSSSAASVSSAPHQFGSSYGNPVIRDNANHTFSQSQSNSRSQHVSPSMASGYQSSGSGTNNQPNNYTHKRFKLRRKHFFAGIAALAVVSGAVYYFKSVGSVPEDQSDNQTDTSTVDQDTATC